MEQRLALIGKLSAIGELAAGVAHELNNPLSVILGFSQSLMRDSGKDPSRDLALQSIEREALRCKRLVQNLLSFTRHHEPAKSEENLIHVLEEALLLIEAQGRVHHVELKREFSKNLPLAVIDRHQIQQVIINLSANAIDAMPQGGTLMVSAARAGGTREGSLIEIRVGDTGLGIPPKIKDRIFEPFFTTKDVGKGTGLGLSLVKEIVQKHQGSIGLKSTVGRGTVFTIRFPVKPPIADVQTAERS